MRKKALSLVVICCIVSITMGTCFVEDIPEVRGVDPFFTLVARIDGNNPRYMDYMNLVKQHLARIGINLDIIKSNPLFENSIQNTEDFDLCYFEYECEATDPDFSDLYSENGTYNVFGYHTDMDYSNSLDTGINENYLEQGKNIYSPNSPERIRNYQQWEWHLLENITPCLPAFSPNEFSVSWRGLEGYNISKGLIQSFGNMTWSTTHEEQENDKEIVISDEAWNSLNPLFQSDKASEFISSAILDPLIWFDCDSSCWPHLASSINILNDTHIRIQSRQGVKWQKDPDELFIKEYYDVDDIYFSLYAWKYLSNEQTNFQWIEKMEKINETTIDIYIDSNPKTTENEPYFRFLESLAKIRILPEHYLNQTQIADGITPDTNHSSWEKFSHHCFGTGMFTLSDFIEGKETTLSLSSRYWGLNDYVVDDVESNFRRRFGDFDNSLEYIKIKIMRYNEYVIDEFENGRIDLVYNLNYSQLKTVQTFDSFNVQNKPSNKFGIIGFNIRPSRNTIGNPDPAPGDASMTVGQAIRKAICYVIDLVEINDVVHGGDYFINGHHLPANLKMWCALDEDYQYRDYCYIHNLDLANEFFAIAGYEIYRYVHTTSFVDVLFMFLFLTAIFFIPISFCILIIYFVVKSIHNRIKDSKFPDTKIKKTHFNCYYCRKSIDREATICPKCKSTIPHCTVCSLPISQKSIIGRCVHCEEIAHLTHLQEWLKVKGYCPNCNMKLLNREILIEGYENDSAIAV